VYPSAQCTTQSEPVTFRQASSRHTSSVRALRRVVGKDLESSRAASSDGSGALAALVAADIHTQHHGRSCAAPRPIFFPDVGPQALPRGLGPAESTTMSCPRMNAPVLGSRRVFHVSPCWPGAQATIRAGLGARRRPARERASPACLGAGAPAPSGCDHAARAPAAKSDCRRPANSEHKLLGRAGLGRARLRPDSRLTRTCTVQMAEGLATKEGRGVERAGGGRQGRGRGCPTDISRRGIHLRDPSPQSGRGPAVRGSKDAEIASSALVLAPEVRIGPLKLGIREKCHTAQLFIAEGPVAPSPQRAPIYPPNPPSSANPEHRWRASPGSCCWCSWLRLLLPRGTRSR